MTTPMKVRKLYIDGQWGQVHVRRAGDGEPLIMLHQSPLSGDMFTAALPHLVARGIQPIAVDTPGFGMSDRPPAPPSIEAYADTVSDVLRGLGLTSAHVIGHHTGAALAASFAARNPAQVKSLILNGVPMFSEEELAYFGSLDWAPMELKADGSHLQATWKRRLDASPGWTNLAAMHRYTVEMLAKPDTYFWGFLAAFAYDIVPDLQRLSVPTLVSTNTGEDLYDASRRAAALRPDHFVYQELIGGTHDIVDEQPEAWANVVADWVLGVRG